MVFKSDGEFSTQSYRKIASFLYMYIGYVDGSFEGDDGGWIEMKNV